MMKKTARYGVQQQGMVSIMVTMIMMLVISLIVLGFAQVSRREQRQSLDRTLSTQAFYAAETGVNDVVEVVNQALAGGAAAASLAKNSCNNNPPASPAIYTPLNAKSHIDDNDGVSYSCVLVTTQSPTIDQDLSADGTSTVVPLEPTAASGRVKTLHLELKLANSSSMSGCPGPLPSLSAGEFKATTNWGCQYGALRVDLVPTDAGLINQGQLGGNQKAFYLYPIQNAAAAVPFTSGSTAGNVFGMRCDLTSCKADITLPTTAASPLYYAMRVSALYHDMSLEVTGTNAALAPVTFQNAQITIDVTGKAQDELRRLRVRIPLNSSGGPGQAIISGSSICKRFGVAPDTFIIPSLTGQDSKNPMCNAVSTAAPLGSLGGGGPGGDALIDGGCAADGTCGGGVPKDPSARPQYTYSITNRSANPPGQVQTCFWDMGDGVKRFAGQNCNNGDTFSYTFPTITAGASCGDFFANGGTKQRYDVKLTVVLQGNVQVTSPVRPFFVPSNC